MAVFDGVCYSLSPSLSPTRRDELSAILDLNGAASHPPYTHLIAPTASHAYNDATNDSAVKLVTDRWVDRSVVMGKRQPEQYYSPDPAMIFSGVVACATDLSTADLEVLSAGITALGGQWRVGLTRDVTHLFALRTGSDKYNTALHFAPQTHMCILAPHWFDDTVRLGRCIPEEPYTWPDPPILRPGMTLDLDDDPLATEGRRKQKTATNTDAEAGESENVGEHVHVWAGRRVLLSTTLELADGSRRAIEARIQRAGGIIVPISEDADEHTEEDAVNEADVLVTRWRSGKSYFKAARGSLLIGTLSWLFSVESSGTLHSPFDSLLWYPTPRGGIPGLIDCEISITNYTGAVRDYLKRLITLVGAKFTPSMSQSNKVLIAGFQPSPKTTRALSWSIPVVNHTWLEDCFVEWRMLTVGLERYIVYPPGVDFGKILMTKHDGPPSSQSRPTQHLSGGAVPGGRGIGIIDVGQEETRDAEYRARPRRDGGALSLSTSHKAFEKATTADGMSMIEGDVLVDSRARPRSRAGSVKKTSSSGRAKHGSTSTPISMSATGAFVDRLIELPADDDNVDRKRRTSADDKQPAGAMSAGSHTSMSRPSPGDLFSTPTEFQVVVRNSGRRSRDTNQKNKGKGKEKRDVDKKQVQPAEEAESDEDAPQLAYPPKPKSRLAQRRQDVQTAQTNEEVEKRPPVEMSKSRRRRAVIGSGPDIDSHSDTGEGSEVSLPPRRPPGAGSATPVKSGMRPRPRSKSRSRPSSVLGGVSEDEAKAVATGPGTGTGAGKLCAEIAKPTRYDAIGTKRQTKGKTGEGKKITRRSRSSTRSPSPTAPGTKVSRTPRRRLSVVVPSVPKEYFSSQDTRGVEGEGDHERETGEKGADAAASGSKCRQVIPATSMHVVAAEASTSKSKRGKPSPAKKSAPVPQKQQPQPHAKTKSKPRTSNAMSKSRADDDEDMGDEEEDDTSMVVDAPPTSTSRGGPRRSAANKATTRLREEIMPDLVNFEKEEKQTKRRRGAAGESVASTREEEEAVEERGAKKRKLPRKGDEEAVVEEDVLLVSSVKAKSIPGNGKRKTKGTVDVGSGDDVNNPPAKSKPSGSLEKKDARGQGKEWGAVRLMTTGVSLLDDVVKRLTKLGVQMTTKPTDCTHLIAKGIVRTEKFLCAMSVSPYILTEEWANVSAKRGKLLPESDYLLSDPAAEQKWDFKFADAIARAKGFAGGSNLFKQMTFYVTPKVSVDVKLLKNVISAGGGQIQTSMTPTVRILNGKAGRYVVSCQEDKGIWRPLVQEGFRVYSPELVLRGALRQEIEWEKEECLVAG